MDSFDKLFHTFASVVYFLMYVIYYTYKGKLNDRFLINGIKTIAFNYLYLNCTYTEFITISVIYYIFSWYFLFETGISI